MNEMETYTYTDLVTDLASAVEQYGARKILLDLEQNYPQHFYQLKAQLLRNTKQVPAILQPKPSAGQSG